MWGVGDPTAHLLDSEGDLGVQHADSTQDRNGDDVSAIDRQSAQVDDPEGERGEFDQQDGRQHTTG